MFDFEIYDNENTDTFAYGFEDYWLLCCGLVYSFVSMCLCLYFLYQYEYVCVYVRLGVYTERSNALPSQISHPITHFNGAGEEKGRAIFFCLIQ